MSRTQRLLAPVALVTALVLGLPLPAHAERWSSADPGGDVVGRSHDPDPQPCGTTTERALPRERAHDLTRLAVVHARDAVQVTAHLRDLRNRELRATFGLRTSNGRWALFVSRYQGGPWPHLRTSATLARAPKRLSGEGECGRAFVVLGSKCAGMTTTVSAAADLVSVLIPRACLHRPRWLRVSVGVFGVSRAHPEVTTVDHWGPPGPHGGFLAPYGPRVRAGHGTLVQNGSPSKVSRVTNSSTSWRRSFVISRAGFPSGTTAATAY
jgi:hypothetical protein